MTEEIMATNLPYIYYNGNASPQITSNHINMINCEINGQTYHDNKVKLTNESKYYGTIVNGIIYNVDYNTNLTLTNTNSILSVITNKLERITSECNEINFVAMLDTTSLPSNRTIDIGKIPYIQIPINDINTYCIYGTDQYRVDGLLYMYISKSGTIQISIPSSISGNIYIKIHITYYSNNL